MVFGSTVGKSIKAIVFIQIIKFSTENYLHIELDLCQSDNLSNFWIEKKNYFKLNRLALWPFSVNLI